MVAYGGGDEGGAGIIVIHVSRKRKQDFGVVRWREGGFLFLCEGPFF